MSFPELQAVLASLLGRVAGSRGAILLDQDGLPIVQVSQDPGLDLERVGAMSRELLRETLAAAGRIGQGRIAEVLLEAEQATLAVIPLKDARSLCLLLAPDAALGRGLFEARRTAFALDQAL